MNWVNMDFIKQHLAVLQKNRVTRNMFQRTNSLSLFDQVDSDFSFSETDEIIEQDADEDEGKKKRKKTFYKKPVRPKVDEKEIKARQKAPTEKKITTTQGEACDLAQGALRGDDRNRKLSSWVIASEF